jgi:hypothetical protein
VGHLISPGLDYVGEVKVIDIGYPNKLVEEEKIQAHFQGNWQTFLWEVSPAG